MASREDPSAALKRLDPQRLRRIAKSMPPQLAQTIRVLADQAESGGGTQAELQEISQSAKGALPELLQQLQGLRAPTQAIAPSGPTPEIRAALRSLYEGVEHAPTRAALAEAERAMRSIDEHTQALQQDISAIQDTMLAAIAALESGKAPTLGFDSQPQAEDLTRKISEDLGRFGGALGLAARRSAQAKLPQARGLAELWLSVLSALPIPEGNLHQLAAQTLCFQGALDQADLPRLAALALPLTGQAMAREDWQQAAVFQHHLADLAQAQDDLEILTTARLKEALLLLRLPEFSETANLMVEDMQRRTEDAPLGIRARVALHAGDVAHGLGQPKKAHEAWTDLLAMPAIEATYPELATRALASLGYGLLEAGKAKRAQKHFERALLLAKPLGDWDLSSAVIRGQLESLMAQNETEKAKKALISAQRIAITMGGQGALSALAELADALSIPR